MTERTALLLGEDGLETLQRAKVIVAGLGGVGGHCAEALARAGVGRLVLVDCDEVTVSNLNRQLVATRGTIGMRKTRAMAERIRAVSDCATETLDARLGADTVETVLPSDASFLVDAIDDVPGKLALATFAHAHGIPMIACMGAGNRLDPTRFRVTDLYATANCPLARRMRQQIRKAGIPALPVVFSDEPAHTAPGQRVIGSLAPVTAAAGLVAAAYAIRVLTGREEQ